MPRSAVPVIGATLATLVFAACAVPGDGPGGPSQPPPPPAPPPPAPGPPPPPPPSGRIEIGQLPSGLRVRAGDQVQLTATVFDSAGNPVAPAQLTWELLDDAAALAAVAPSGLVTFRSDTVLGGTNFRFRVRSGELADTVRIFSRDWHLSVIPGGLQVRLAPQPAPGALPNPWDFVSVSCAAGTASAALEINGFGNSDPQFEYRFTGEESSTAVWRYSVVGFDAAIYAPDHFTALAFAERLLTSDTLHIMPPAPPERSWILHAPDWLRERVLGHCD